jgi:uncharacterized alkaline shock family protein YloU
MAALKIGPSGRKGATADHQEECEMADEQQTTAAQQQKSPLQSDRGTTRVEDPVVAKVAGLAAQEVDGVKMGTGSSRTFGGIRDAVTGGGGETRGVKVEVGQIEAAVDLTLMVEYGKSIPSVAEQVRSNIIRRIENLVGLRVTEVNIVVDDIYFEGQQPHSGQEGEQETGRELGRVH